MRHKIRIVFSLTVFLLLLMASFVYADKAIVLDPIDAKMSVGEKQQYQVYIGNGLWDASAWRSSDTSVATVSSTGMVTAVAPGKAVISCDTGQYGRVTTTVTVGKSSNNTGSNETDVSGSNSSGSNNNGSNSNGSDVSGLNSNAKIKAAKGAYLSAIRNNKIKLPSVFKYAIEDADKDGYPELILFNEVHDTVQYPPFQFYTYKNGIVRLVLQDTDELTFWHYNKDTRVLSYTTEGDGSYLQLYKFNGKKLKLTYRYETIYQNGPAIYHRIRNGKVKNITHAKFQKKWNAALQTDCMRETTREAMMNVLAA